MFRQKVKISSIFTDELFTAKEIDNLSTASWSIFSAPSSISYNLICPIEKRGLGKKQTTLTAKFFGDF